MKKLSPHDSDLEFGDSIEIGRAADELVVIHELLELDGKDILDLGCGRGEMTRAIAANGTNRNICALEVDEIQNAINLKVGDLANVRFGLGGAEAIPADECSFDVVFMFKSLHHVPVGMMTRALSEVARVLRFGGFAYISEPLFRGGFNEVLRIFNDESHVRERAFEAIVEAKQSGKLELVSQTFLNTPLHYTDFDEFERLIIGSTYSNHSLTSEVLEQVRSAFARHANHRGVRFEEPIRIDLLRKPS